MKPRRDITLGEMQDECKRINGNCVGLAFVTEDCKYKSVCPFQMQSRKALAWDLTDPPRFTEAQMALLKALWENGASKIKVVGMGIVALNEKGLTIYLADILREIEGETLDLAELFGKEGK